MNLFPFFLRLLLQVFSVFPLRILHMLAQPLAWIARISNGREARVTRKNIALCFPHLDQLSQADLMQKTLGHTACNLTELAAIWGRLPARALHLVREVRGREHLDSALKQGRGVIVAAPHLGAWELLNLYLGTLGPLAILYRVPQRPQFETFLLRVRGGSGADQIRADAQGVRQLFRRLKEGRILGILPDQRPKGGEGEASIFFGHRWVGMSLLSRLANKSDAPVVFGFAERLPNGAGFRIHFLPAPTNINSADTAQAVGALAQGIEQCIALAPEQYQWNYKIFGLGEQRQWYE